jgi:hypothetical protein
MTTQRLCPDGHAWTSWTTAERTNDVGEKCFVFQRECCACGLVDTEAGAIVEPR